MASIPFIWEEEPGKPNFPNNNNNNFIVHDHDHVDCHGSSPKVRHKLPLPPIYGTLLMEAESVTTAKLSRSHSFVSFKLQSLAHYIKKTFFASVPTRDESTKKNYTENNSIQLDCNNDNNKNNNKNKKNYSAPLPRLGIEPTTTNNNKGNNNGSSLRRCSSEREREKSRRQLIAMFDPTCSALHQLFPLKTSATTTAASAASSVSESPRCEEAAAINKAINDDGNHELISNLQNIAHHEYRNGHSSYITTTTRFGLPLEARVGEELSKGGYSNNHGSTLDSSQRIAVLQDGQLKSSTQEKEKEEEEEERGKSWISNSNPVVVPCPKISRVLLNLVEREEMRLISSRRRQRGKQQLQCFNHPVFSSIAHAVLCRSKHSKAEHFLSSSWPH